MLGRVRTGRKFTSTASVLSRSFWSAPLRAALCSLRRIPSVSIMGIDSSADEDSLSEIRATRWRSSASSASSAAALISPEPPRLIFSPRPPVPSPPSPRLMVHALPNAHTNPLTQMGRLRVHVVLHALRRRHRISPQRRLDSTRRTSRQRCPSPTARSPHTFLSALPRPPPLPQKIHHFLIKYNLHLNLYIIWIFLV